MPAPTSLPAPSPDPDTVIAQTRRWLEKAVIGLNLCPFAKAVHVKGQIRYVVSAATEPAALRAELAEAMRHLVVADPARTDTTLLIHPGVLGDFLDFNDFLGEADELLEELGLDGTLQVASFHPQFQFAGTRPDDPGNNSNRAPYPTLHLLREASVDAAVQAFPEAEAIYERNIETLQALGQAGWARLFETPAEPPPEQRG
ncbi:MAG TPA: DUF1415 domain-containing protein [Ideonella sp.]|uniref:DUF1415 domain-containing protein n=1 Tax=Ideonella sp. TaxID=1929293 RepID=UPI002B61E143|nr:DUF1415 domain-containing protein [Ideonella sp.]